MITVAALNPCMDETILMESFKAGATNRAIAPAGVDAGGKGFNVACALRALGEEVCLVGFLPEQGSDVYKNQVSEIFSHHALLSCPGQMRVNTKVIDRAGVLTEINRRGFVLQDAAYVREMINRCLRFGAESDLVVFSGSTPDGITPDFYAHMANELAKRHVPVMIDASGAALVHAVKSSAVLIKPNLEEFCALIGRSVQPDDLGEMIRSGRNLARCGPMIALSLGAHGMLLITQTQAFYAPAPRIDQVASTVGAGDNALAAMAQAWVCGLRGSALLRAGVAAGTASVLRQGTAPLEKRQFDRLFAQVEVQKLE